MRILILNESMISGGIEKSIVNFLNLIDYNKHEVDLFLNKPVGSFLEFIPKGVNILNLPDRYNSQCDEAKTSNKSIKRIILKFLSSSRLLQKVGARTYYYKKMYKETTFIKKYDLAIVHNGFFNLLYLIKDKVCASKKVAICHGDYAFFKKSIQVDALKYYKGMDKVYFVSKSCENKFNSLYPKSKVNTDVLYNVIDTQEILKNAEAYTVEYPNVFNIVSVSRLSEEKAHLRTLSVLKSLHDEGLDFCWHVVGEGPMRSKIEEFIANNNMSDYIKLYGNQNNPYPYIKAADLLFLGSLNEAFGLVLVEAMLLKIVPLTTRTCSADEVVGQYGFVCENTEEGIYQSLKKIITKEVDLTSMRERLKSYSYDNQVNFNKIIK